MVGVQDTPSLKYNCILIMSAMSDGPELVQVGLTTPPPYIRSLPLKRCIHVGGGPLLLRPNLQYPLVIALQGGGSSSESDSSSEESSSCRCLVEMSDIPIRLGSSSSSSQQTSTACPSVGANTPPKTDHNCRLGLRMTHRLSFAVVPHSTGYLPHSSVVTSCTPILVRIKM
jgi:hypothetical protein